MPTQRKLRKREVLFAVLMGAVAAGGAAAILSDGGGGPSQPFIVANQASEMTYQVADFERISTTGPQDVDIEFGEEYSVRAEGAVGQLEVVVEGGQLIIRPREVWNIPALSSTKLFITVPRLTGLNLNGSSDISIDGLKSERFAGVIEGGFGGNIDIEGLDVDQVEFTINGPGDISAAGIARATRVTINGPGEVQAGELQSQTAAITVRGPGDVELAVEQEADISVEGPGEVDIDGSARCSISTSGPGSVSCGNQDTD